MAGLFQAIFGGGKKEEAPKQLPAPAAPNPADSLAAAQKAAADQRRAAIASGGTTATAGGAGVGLPGQKDTAQKTLVGQ
jgi:hypothetical protein